MQEKNTEKLTDKAFTRMWIASVISILICITCLGSTTWAWFLAGHSSNENTLQSGRFALDVTATGDQNTDGAEITVLPSGKTSCTFAQGRYTVVLTTTLDTTVKTGFCTVLVGDREYHTDAIDIDGNNSFTFTLDVAADDTKVIFSPSWGLPARIDVIQGEVLQIGVASSETE